ncbi:hypothetical protein [Desulfolucanica intricata]|uniref:hypothetical protein n=1 Tax=Desulfolucanica intricata TaxID=1285191 RepID=UPI000A765A72|nr:hypothetical protein [Desulfolucanica intricata]
MSELEIRDKLEINLPPRVTMQVTALTISTGKTLNEIIVEALMQYINKKKNSHGLLPTR